jgi:hypothetical protein
LDIAISGQAGNEKLKSLLGSGLSGLGILATYLSWFGSI